jgi:SsrA-binding protein
MAKRTKKGGGSDAPADKVIENRKARYDYAVSDTLECGIILKGSEVKSLRDGQASIAEGFVRVELGALKANVKAEDLSPKSGGSAPPKPASGKPSPTRRRVEPGLYLHGSTIAEYPPAGPSGSAGQHKPTRVRTLLCHHRELVRLAREVSTKGYALVPLKIYFKNGKAKLLIGLGKSKTQSDKRDTITKRDAQRDIARAMSRRA